MGKYCIFILQRNLHEIFNIIIVLKHVLEIHYLNTTQVEILMIFYMLNYYVMIRCFFWNIENENQKCFHSLQYKKILKWKGKNIKTWEWHTNFRKSNEFESYWVYPGIFESEKGGIRKSEAGYTCSRGFTSSISGQMAWEWGKMLWIFL